VIVEPYKVEYLSGGTNSFFFLGNEYFNPVCGADALLPPYTGQLPTIVQNPDGSYGYLNLQETYTPVLNALEQKNARNASPMALINQLPGYTEINVEWPPVFWGWQGDTDFAIDQVSNFLVGPVQYYAVTADAKPFTLCASPAVMKMLGLAPAFRKNGHTIDDINSPANNMNVTLPGTDGAIVIPDLTKMPPPGSPPTRWMFDSTDAAVVKTQLPKAFFENSANLALPQLSCSDPTLCIFPAGASGGVDLIGVINHEINHVLGAMQSQYYKVDGEATAIAYTYGTALFLLDLFDVDSDFVVPGYGNPGVSSYADFKALPRNNNTFEPTTVRFASDAADLTPFVQLGQHDHVFLYDVRNGVPLYFPLMNFSTFNPDGDIQFQNGYVLGAGSRKAVFVDPDLVNLAPMNVVHTDVQAASFKGTIDVDTIREYSELAAQGWNIDYSTLRDVNHTQSPLWKWYQTCFDANGVFTTAVNAHCKFSVLPRDLDFLQ
jgi:hypothetical protein